ncbi:hypothetical protein BKA82DRAFT_10848 [Pisolithus tinctorius]|uniref:Uncharacterized protein n=1 Tax=Pisolithus tinctorius Marx 270 TaxID=870435 RepID=A0A0C3IIY7_PISTI|nr:hypothetical protein BKA82DRAFT_10848 [Pisolithus tinctorius]KIN96942.1 hypothetical protein M404DRAFT_10848 [Pisolithus tinctorius Marx 270]
MDCGRLPSYRSSYLLRFHPYARVKPSARERVMAVQYTDDGSLLSDEERLITSSQSAVWDSVPADAIAQNLNDAINDTTAVDEPLRRLSISTLVVHKRKFITNCPGVGAVDGSQGIVYRDPVHERLNPSLSRENESALYYLSWLEGSPTISLQNDTRPMEIHVRLRREGGQRDCWEVRAFVKDD